MDDKSSDEEDNHRAPTTATSRRLSPLSTPPFGPLSLNPSLNYLPSTLSTASTTSPRQIKRLHPRRPSSMAPSMMSLPTASTPSSKTPPRRRCLCLPANRSVKPRAARSWPFAH
ncbi:hypothetical protein L484_012734 [Morus notabilis]|uniref:Uncharacterized protein n=1 Tax=Morus notabilis TaxID=981085 RepID=W9RID0_9ROSA|nr:hypothetical protein L484_012734 [Morus notabilis]